MEAIILVGIQASGKSSFYKERFFDTHVRINLDMLKTKHRQQALLDACLASKQPFVVDNTNATVEKRSYFISAARAAGFRVVGYYLRSDLDSALSRNDERGPLSVSYTHLRAHETPEHLVCRLLLEKKKTN